MTLVEFIRARLAELYESARGADGAYVYFDAIDDSARDFYIERDIPKLILADVDAKRRILDEHAPRSVTGFDVDGWEHTEDMCAACVSADNWPCQTLRLLALPYASHPDYREEWRP